MRFACSFFLMFLMSLLFALPLSAQEQTGNLEGKVMDSSGGILPGVTVTISGSAILGGARTAVTSDSGTYNIRNVPVGSYQVNFELSGFGKMNYEDVQIRAGTTFTLNATLGVAGIEETVTVTGESPIIETKETDVSFNFTVDLMDTVPNARDAWALVGQTPGVVTDRVNVGGTETGNQQAFRGHGVDPRQNTYMLNGANVSDNTNNGASQFYFDVNSFDEVQVEINSHSAEIQTPGMLMNIVPKSGSNDIHGAYSLFYGSDGIQADNVDDSLRALGVDRASNLQRYLDTGGDIGGPIVQDKLWFWGAFRVQEVKRFVTGTQLADGSFPIDRTWLWYPNLKLNWLINEKHNFSFYFNMAQKKRFNRGLSATRPLETTRNQQGAPIARLFSFRDDWTPSPNMLVNFNVNIMDQGFELIAQDNVDIRTTPARYDEGTSVWADAPDSQFGIGKNLRGGGVKATYFVDNLAGGSHEFKFGFDVASYKVFGNQLGSVAITIYPADHRLILLNGEPNKVTLYSADAQSVNNPTYHAFAQDSWQLGRVRLNLGLRWDWQANSLNAVTAPESTFLEPVSQEATGNLVKWNTLAPRLGAVYDLTGDAKTLLKASYGRYYWQLWVDKGQQAGVAGDRDRTYEWLDLNGNGRFDWDDPFDPANTPELGQLLSANDPLAGRQIEDGLSPTKTDEITVGVTRELASNVSLSGTYMYRQDNDLSFVTNPGISSSDYTPVTGTDPGPDGILGTSDDGGPLTFYEIADAKKRFSPNLIATQPGFNQEYQGFELTVNRRFADNWQAVGSLTTGVQRDNYAQGAMRQLTTSTLPTPQDVDLIAGTRVANSNPYIVKFMGSYALPHNIMISAFYQYVSGNHFTRTVNSSTALGRTLNQGNITVLSGERNQDSYDGLNILDFRVGYELKIAESRVMFNFDLFNLFNVNTITSIVTTSGSNFGSVNEFIPPRMARFGVKLRF